MLSSHELISYIEDCIADGDCDAARLALMQEGGNLSNSERAYFWNLLRKQRHLVE